LKERWKVGTDRKTKKKYTATGLSYGKERVLELG
jgi:hypothetical protein